MKHFEELSNFIKSNSDWLEQLKPWLKSYHECDYNTDWVILMYNLFEIPKDETLYKIICECRGTVVNKKTGEIVCAPFTKFWNYGEEKADKNIDWKKAMYTHKRDGWLCKLTKQNNKAYIFTNGMFLSKTEKSIPVESSIHPEYNFNCISDVLLYCLKANGFNNDGSVKWEEPNWFNNMSNGDTIMFELESPWNVIHTNLVNEPNLWLIGYRKNNGEELNVWKELKDIPFNRPKVYSFTSDKELIKTLSTWTVDKEGEGIVVLYIDNQNDFHRVKIKCEDYLRVKYMEECSYISDNALFKLMLNGEADDLIANKSDLAERANLIESKLNTFKNKVKNISDYMKWMQHNYPNKKDLVEILRKEKPNDYSFYLNCSKDNYLDRTLNSWKVKSNGYDDLCKLC